MKKFKRGVTLIELAVVISVILLLVLVGSVVFFQSSDRAAREDSLVALKGVATALKMYQLSEGVWPAAITPWLQPYANITNLQTRFQSGNITIYRTSGVACVSGINVRIEPLYYVNYCVEAGGNNRTFLTNQPTCCWKVTCSLDSTNDANWYPCTRGL